MSAADVAVRIHGVGHQFGEAGETHYVRALSDTSLDIARGELLCLIGPSGCGKSTLLNIIGGLMPPSSGRVEVGGRPLRGPLPREIAYVFQENALFPWNTVLENVRLGMLFQGVPRSEHAARAKQSLEAVGLADFAHHYPGQLSGGMRQRAALARALSLETGILLMDEPFGALDEQTRMILGEDLSVLLARTEKTIVFVTHSLGEAVFLADRVAVFSARPGTIKKVIRVDEPHPRRPDFVTSEKFTVLRNELYALLHDEIRKAASEPEGAAYPRKGQITMTSNTSYFARHWRGELSLPKSYWLNGVLIFGLGCNLVFIAAFLATVATVRSSAPLAILILLCDQCFDIAAYIWALVGTWRAARNYKGPKFWAALARIGMSLGVIISIVHLTQNLSLIGRISAMMR